MFIIFGVLSADNITLPLKSDVPVLSTWTGEKIFSTPDLQKSHIALLSHFYTSILKQSGHFCFPITSQQLERFPRSTRLVALQLKPCLHGC